jgi:hypothetical protein
LVSSSDISEGHASLGNLLELGFRLAEVHGSAHTAAAALATLSPAEEEEEPTEG